MRDAAATRRKLLRAAQRRFVLHGYDRTTIRDVADDAGVNLSLISRYFDGKAGLYRAAVEASSELMSEHEPPRDPVDGFLATLSTDAWPDLGAHPLTLMLRDDGASDLRRAALRRAAESLAAETSADPLAAQLVLALTCGLVVLRDTLELEPLASASPDELRPLLRRAFDALLADGG